MLSVNPYLSFNGNCEEAFGFYQSVFGKEAREIVRYKDVLEQNLSDSEKEKVMHISLPLTKAVTLMGADMSDTVGHTARFGNNVMLTLTTESEQEARQIFENLSAGGTVTMPLEKTFWAKLCGLFTDRFGINWAINLV
jgi:PhnB protein